MITVLNQDERKIIADAADAAGLSLSSYLRTTALAAARVPITWATHDAVPIEFEEYERERLQLLAEHAGCSFAEVVRILSLDRAQQILDRAGDATAADRIIAASRAAV